MGDFSLPSRETGLGWYHPEPEVKSTHQKLVNFLLHGLNLNSLLF